MLTARLTGSRQSTWKAGATRVLHRFDRYALPLTLIAAGLVVLGFDASAGVGWALLVMGLAFLAAVLPAGLMPASRRRRARRSRSAVTSRGRRDDSGRAGHGE